MKTLLVLKDEDVGWETQPAEYKERTAARAVVFDETGHVALLHSTVKKYHKLPGGGVEAGEAVIQGLEREVEEEIGCQIDHIEELGSIEEFRSHIALHQWSHCYKARVAGEKGEPHLTSDEADEGFVTEWMPLQKAIDTLESEVVNDHYQARFMTRRDLTFLQAAQG